MPLYGNIQASLADLDQLKYIPDEVLKLKLRVSMGQWHGDVRCTYA